MKYNIGIDLGGTNIAAGLVNEDYEVVYKTSVKTNIPRPPKEIADDMISLVKKILDDNKLTLEDINSIGVGVPGTANLETGILEDANNLQMENVPLVNWLEEGLKEKVYFENDAKAAAWGEYLAGAGKGSNSLVAVTLGTGIGGGIIMDRKIYRGVNFASGEIGHTVINFNGIECNCGRRGCYEVYASATALINQAKDAMKENINSLLWEKCNQNLENLDGKMFFQAVAANDIVALKVLEQYNYYLSIGITNIINTFQPDVLCIGGGISKVGNLILDPLRSMVSSKRYSQNSKKQTKIVTAKLGNDAGIIGAALLYMEK